MIPNIPTLALRFDIDKAGGGYYGFTCWKGLWSVVEPGAIGGSSLYEGDARATLDGRERVFLVAIQNLDRGKLRDAERALAADASFMKIAASPAFAHDPEVCGEPLADSGQIDGAGNLVGQGATARSALGEIRRAQSAARPEGAEGGIPIGTTDFPAADRISRMEAQAPGQAAATPAANAHVAAGLQVGKPAPRKTKGSRIWGGVFLVIGAVIVYTAILVLATVIAGSQAGFRAKSDVFPILVFYGVLTALCLWAGIKRTRRWERFLGIAFLILGALVLFARLNLSRVRLSEEVFTKAATITGIVLLFLGVTLFLLDLAKRRAEG